MTTAATPTSSPATGAMPSPRQQFLDAYEREHAITMKILRAYPPDKAELRPHPKLKTARELAYIFVQECGLGIAGVNDALGKGHSGPRPPPGPEKWEDILPALEKAHVSFRQTFESFTDQQLLEPIKFYGAPKTLVDYSRLQFAWFLLSNQIPPRGQLSVYLRMADAKGPSIYGPTADEPWR